MNTNKKARPKKKETVQKVDKQWFFKYKSPVPVKFSNGEEMFAMRENSSKPLIVKHAKDRIT